MTIILQVTCFCKYFVLHSLYLEEELKSFISHGDIVEILKCNRVKCLIIFKIYYNVVPMCCVQIVRKGLHNTVVYANLLCCRYQFPSKFPNSHHVPKIYT